MKNSFYLQEELRELGFKSFGKKVLISKFTRTYSPEKIEIGDNVRIDDFCILSGSIKLGSHIHIGAGSYFFGGNAGIEMEDFSGCASDCKFYAITENHNGDYLMNSTIYNDFRDIIEKEVHIKKHTTIGTNCAMLPGVVLEEGTYIGANSLINKSTKPWGIYFGSPARRIKDRSKNLLKLEEEFLKEWNNEKENLWLRNLKSQYILHNR